MKHSRILILLLAVILIAGCLAACNGDGSNDTTDTTDTVSTDSVGSEGTESTDTAADSTGSEESDTADATDTSGVTETETTTAKTEVELAPFVDYVDQLKLDMTSSTKKAEVTMKQHIDGDTTHFFISTSEMERGFIKARYIAINTPESTGQIEEWGKAASTFTKEKLSSAASIIIECDGDAWDPDSTGDRYLVWVWYKPSEDADYRNLNLEILQNGLAIANKSANNRYGDICMKAIAQATAYKKYVYSGDKDPDFYYGGAIELNIKELRSNPEAYANRIVAFEGVITYNDGESVHVEAFDEITNMYHGISVYYGFNLNGAGKSVLKPGNKVRIVGSMQYYEAGGTWQVTDLHYDMLDPTNPSNIQKLGNGEKPAYTEVSIDTLLNSKVPVTIRTVNDDGEEIEETKELVYAELALNSTVSMKNLKVVSTYTTHNGGDNDGAISITCEVDGKQIVVRTVVLKDDDGNVITADTFTGKTIDVKGVVSVFDGAYQIKLLSMKDVVIK